MNPPFSTLVCYGCGHRVAADEPLAFRCPRAGDGDEIDHVLRVALDTEGPNGREDARDLFSAPVHSPFLEFRGLLHGVHRARRAGLDDAEIVGIIESLDRAVTEVDGKGFAVTPFALADDLAREIGLLPGRLWVKDETGNVSGSHKGRHLMGVMICLEAGRARRLRDGDTSEPPRLAIASCGNAALAAAVVARAADYSLEVFVPANANTTVCERLRNLGATLTPCPRRPGEAGDPCFLRFREAVAANALPFTCQGSENGLVIEGGKTLIWECLADLLASDQELDRLFVQTGGGALASACIQGLTDAEALGLLDRLPRIHAVQSTGASPLRRAWEGVVTRIIERQLGADAAAGTETMSDSELAFLIRDQIPWSAVEHELHWAAHHRGQLMWPWENEPVSVATGILDDETYDWLAVCEGMLRSAGYPIVVDENTLETANRLARETTGIAVDATGTAGLAGLLDVQRNEGIAPDEIVAVLFTGQER